MTKRDTSDTAPIWSLPLPLSLFLLFIILSLFLSFSLSFSLSLFLFLSLSPAHFQILSDLQQKSLIERENADVIQCGVTSDPLPEDFPMEISATFEFFGDLNCSKVR